MGARPTHMREAHSMNDISANRARCGQCERDVTAIFCCPERSSGRCPFIEKWSGNVFARPSRWIVIVACALVIGVIFGKSIWIGGVMLAFLAITHVFFETIREALLYNPKHKSNCNARPLRESSGVTGGAGRLGCRYVLKRLHTLFIRPASHRSIRSFRCQGFAPARCQP